MTRTFAARRYLTTALLLGAGASTFVACLPFDTEEEYDPPINGSPEIVTAAKPPPAINGGTLAVSGDIAVAADADRDRVSIVDLKAGKSIDIELNEDDEPGRVALDAEGRAHVILRRGGAVATIDIASAKLLERRSVCAAPRGLAVDNAQSLIHVACAGGEIVSLPAAGGDPVRVLRTDRDLRDILVSGDSLVVTRFRSAELLKVSASGLVVNRIAPPAFKLFEQGFEPSVAWRTVPLPNGAFAMVHQRAMTTPVQIEQGGYASGGCDGSIVHGTITVFPDDHTVQTDEPAAPAIPFAILPVDVAASKDGGMLGMVAAGNNTVFRTSPSDIAAQSGGDEFGGGCGFSQLQVQVDGQPVAIAFDDANNMVVQTREPASLVMIAPGGNVDTTIDLGGISVKDTGHEMFHTNPNGKSALACASCHPGGTEDGRTWNFDPIGPRRTQSIGGGILKTAPLHWDGDMAGLDTIMAEVFVKRMGGVSPGPRRIKVLARWIDALPVTPRSDVVDTAAVKRGDALFHDAKVGCATCHSGAMLTNNKSADVGTGQAFQVPTLVNIAARAPFMHDGCAPTLHDRFTSACGGGDAHGVTSHLSQSDIDDLVAYLETL